MAVPVIRSLPALAAAMRTTGRRPFEPVPTALMRERALVPMYRVSNHLHEREVHEAIQSVETITERIRRLAAAYGEWDAFDPGAYFDLTPAQTAALVRVTERVSTVHVTFYTDLLLPTFRRAATYWAGHFVNAHAAAFATPLAQAAPTVFDDDFSEDAQPEMVRLWRKLHAIMADVRATLGDDPGFMATLATRDEQARWYAYWSEPATAGIADELLPALAAVPTLTLMYEFPLPAYRQSGRRRRLRQNRERRRRRRSSHTR
ncbi:MAG: hypothetical protein KDD83_17125 [Caldilineaceae bacterium]|nr:hypothetical protein [Caldilineaceae bacterium]